VAAIETWIVERHGKVFWHVENDGSAVLRRGIDPRIMLGVAHDERLRLPDACATSDVLRWRSISDDPVIP